MPTAFLTRRGVSLPQLSVLTNFDRDSAIEVRDNRSHPLSEGLAEPPEASPLYHVP